MAYRFWIEASQKFDYFVTGISLALVGYLWAGLHLTTLALNPETLELAATATLLASSIAGLKRIETNVTLMGAMHKRLYEEEAAGSIAAAASKGQAAVNVSTGQVLSLSDLIQRAYGHKIGAAAAEQVVGDLATSSGRWYQVRNGLLIGGFVLLIAARLLPALLG